MSQSGYTPIQLYRTSTTSAAPSAGNLADGELAINITDGKLFYKDNLGAVQTIADKNVTGTVTSVGMTVPTFLSVSPSSITTSGTFAVTLSGTALPTANGGTGLTGFTAGNNAIYSTSSSALTAGTLPIAAGGTGATTASAALSNLGGINTGKAVAMSMIFGF